MLEIGRRPIASMQVQEYIIMGISRSQECEVILSTAVYTRSDSGTSKGWAAGGAEDAIGTGFGATQAARVPGLLGASEFLTVTSVTAGTERTRHVIMKSKSSGYRMHLDSRCRMCSQNVLAECTRYSLYVKHMALDGARPGCALHSKTPGDKSGNE
jgi:hypothetical protein